MLRWEEALSRVHIDLFEVYSCVTPETIKTSASIMAQCW